MTLEAVINVSEGRDSDVLDALRRACGAALLDVHTDADHNRSVFTLAGEPETALQAALRLTRIAAETIDVSTHSGVHPRIGAIDVVPFVALPGTPTSIEDALAARAAYAGAIATELEIPCFLYGPERTLPDIRRHAFVTLQPDVGPSRPHSTAGAIAVGQRPVLIAYNLWLQTSDVTLAKAIAKEIRSSDVRSLGLEVGGQAQVSCNLIDPQGATPADVFDSVARRAPIARAELVGLITLDALNRVPMQRRQQLDLCETKTIEHRLANGTSVQP